MSSRSVSEARIPVEPSVMRWARERAGLRDLAAAAKRLGVSAATLEGWESGAKQPTIIQLRKAAKTYQRPLAVLLLPEAPEDFDALRDFRSPSTLAQGEWTPALTAEYRRALAQREVYLEIAQTAPALLPAPRERWSLDRSGDIEQLALTVRGQLGMDDWPAKVIRDPNLFLNATIDAVESLGMIVIHTRDVSISEMRGFSISEWPFPVIALNGSDHPRPRLFTLLHELAHIGFNTGGLCDLHEDRVQARVIATPEHQCNALAAAILMPKSRVVNSPLVSQAGSDSTWSVDDLREMGSTFGASGESMLLRLITLRKASWALYWQLKPEMDAAYDDYRKAEKERQRAREGGPSYYVVKARDLSHSYVGKVVAAYESRAISSIEAAHYLDVKFDQIPKLIKVVRR